MQSSGEHGVVLFTMGFIFNPKVVPTRLVNAFMEAFGRLPQKFLVKFEGPINNAPPNVKVLEWIPQVCRVSSIQLPNLTNYFKTMVMLSCGSENYINKIMHKLNALVLHISARCPSSQQNSTLSHPLWTSWGYGRYLLWRAHGRNAHLY